MQPHHSRLPQHDIAIWHTTQINSLIDSGRAAELPNLLTPFPVADSGTVLADGTFRLLNFESAGNGTYVHQSGFVFGTGGVGLAIAGGFALAQAAGNSRRRREAAALAQPQWRQIDAGQLWISTSTLHFSVPSQYYTWTYDSIDSMTLVAPRQAQFSGRSAHGPITWILESDWAELAFTVWARARHPRHPQFMTRGWIPPGWHDRAHLAGLPPIR
ncbi:hypothetical protein JVX90_19855 [Gordonia sp. PDNC005]|uniref:hypothetical protein n=1 Tax=unclassified Gordonia (in: high G+C Gram-positive bacteria) TaxID=2657482 RepID=UPI001965FEB2|nr:hypothetical protein [Gordonia sp. PDNC005]QRY62584.1 hypothetical protein JVX90_19855 [Gordonia sp. PDNC005]